jgi:hypothetical protein
MTTDIINTTIRPIFNKKDKLPNAYFPHENMAIRVIKIEKIQRFCLKCGKILPTKIPRNYAHNCEKPDFLL